MPKAFALFHGLKIFEDTAIQVIDLLEALLHQVVRSLFAANTAGAEHRNLAVFLWVKRCINELWKLPKRLRIGRYSILKRADAALISIASVNCQHLGVLQEFIPAFCVYPFTAELTGVSVWHAHGDNLPLEADFHSPEREDVGAGLFVLECSEPRIRLEIRQQIIDALARPRNGSV